MDFEQLRTFVEVSRQRSFSRAAEKLHRTQPAISAQIRSLEKEVGARLFERDGGKVTFTAAGRLFEPFAEHCLECQGHIALAVSELERAPRGELSISANEATSLYVLPPVFAQFKRQYSRVSLNIVRAERARTLDLVLGREVDFGVVSLPIKHPRLHAELIHRDELVVVAAPQHPWASRKSLRMTDLSQQPMLMPKHGHRRTILEALFARHKIIPRVVMDVESSELLKKLVLAGLGIGLLPRANVLEEVSAHHLVAWEVDRLRLPRDLAIVYRRDRPLNRASQAFLEIALSIAKSARPASPRARER